ncbi:MAG: tetratricopeptide repeat protein [Parvularculaceae bacterium]|nr:tetratricopeptide repeat protein [Parvularculaceae bacterium]
MKHSNKLSVRSAQLLIAVSAFVLASCASPEQRLEKYNESGARFLEDGKLGMANVQFLNALKIDEQNVDALIGLKAIAEKKGDYSQMFGLLQRLNRIDSKNVRVRMDLAKLYLLGNEAADALELADSLIAEDPKNAEALAIKSAILFRLGNSADAVTLAKQSLAIDPKLADAVAVLASDRVKEKDLEGALAILDGAIAADGSVSVLQLLRVQVLSSLGRTDDVRAAYLSLVEQNPKDANYRRLYVTALLEKGELEKARAQLVEIAGLVPKQNEAKLDIVRVDFRIGGRAKAEDTFKRLIADNPEEPDLKFAYGGFLREQNDLAAAEKVYAGIASRKDADLDEILRAKNELAAIRISGGKRAEAEAIIDEILKADAKDSGALTKRAGFKIESGDIDGAVADLRLVVNDNPDFWPPRLLLAAAFEQKGDLNLAESEFARAVETSKRAARPSHLYARYLIRQNKMDRAIKALTDSLAIDPDDADNLKLLAALRLDQQDWRGAEEAAKALAEVNKDDPVVGSILGAAYSGLGDFSGAIAALSTEHERRPLESRPLASLIQAYIDAGRLPDAEAFLKNAIAKNKSNYDARILLGQLQRDAGASADAVVSLQSAIAIEPLRPEAYEVMYGVYAVQGRRQEAGRTIEQAIAALPDNDGLQILKADHFIAERKFDEAISIYETILARRPNDLIVANNLASLLSERDDEASLKRASEVAASLRDAQNPYFVDTYGWALYRAGDKAAGIAALAKAAAAAPSVVDIRYHYGIALLDSGDVAKGRAELEAVIAAPNAAPDRVVDARRRLGQ